MPCLSVRSLYVRRLFVPMLFFVVPVILVLVLHAGLAHADTPPSPTDALPPVQAAESDLAAVVDETDTGTEIIRGLVVSRPVGSIGPWVIRITPEQTRTVLVNNWGALETSPVPPSSWVYIETKHSRSGLSIAKNLRLDSYEPGQIVARLVSGVTPDTVAERYHLTISSTLLASANIYLFATSRASDNVERLTRRMTADAEIRWAELNYIGDATEGDPYKSWGWGGPDPGNFSQQNAFVQVNLDPALEYLQGDGIVVALLDTGIDLSHPALAGHWLPGIDLVAEDDDPQDEGPGLGWGHGTHIAGLITHIAPQSRLLPVRVLDSNARGDVFTLAYAIDWAVEHDADVINLSLGTDFDASVLRHALENAYDQGVIVVAAAGNDNSDTPQYPVAYDTVIGVTAVTSDNVKADFASYGPWVELAAPGVNITSTIIGPQGSGYAYWSGTSMSTAFGSGAAALARQRFPDASPAELMAELTSHARNPDVQNPDIFGQMGGLLNIGETILDGITPPITPISTPTPTSTPTVTPPTTPISTPTPTSTPTVMPPTTPISTPTPTSTPTVMPPTDTPVPTPTPSPVLELPVETNYKLYCPLTMS